jgi:hypothetical protein
MRAKPASAPAFRATYRGMRVNGGPGGNLVKPAGHERTVGAPWPIEALRVGSRQVLGRQPYYFKADLTLIGSKPEGREDRHRPAWQQRLSLPPLVSVTSARSIPQFTVSPRPA